MNTGKRTESEVQFLRKTMLLLPCIMFFALCSLGSASPVYADRTGLRERIALFPFENLTEDRNALQIVMPVIREKLESLGYEILDDDSLDNFLLKERVRCTGYISRDTARKLRDELRIDAVLVGAVNTFSNRENPMAGFSARLVDSSSGAILWADHAAATGEDFTTVLGLGRISDIGTLSAAVIDKMLRAFSTVQPLKEKEATYRVAVMPFQNKSRVKDAGMIITYMFIVELFRHTQFEPIEFGDVRCLLVNLRVREKGELDFRTTDAISESSGVDGVILGTVDMYAEGEGSTPPEVSICARLLDARREKMLWCDSSQARGDDSISVFDWGRLRAAENVAYKVVSELVHGMSGAKWQ